MSQQGPYVITGAVGGGAPNRLEIYDLVKDEAMFSLFIQALGTSRYIYSTLVLLVLTIPD